MFRIVFVTLAVLILACSAAPGERVRRHGYDVGPGGHGYGGAGYGGNGYPGGNGYGALPLQQTFSKSSASASSSGGAIAG